MAISDETLALAIPPELKTDHPDASLVVQGILIAIAANENSGGLSAKGRMRDTFAALQTVYVPIFQAHIAKEDEDWGNLKAIAEKYRPSVTITAKRERPTLAQYVYTGDESGTVFAMAEDNGQWSAETMDAAGNVSQRGEGQDARSAVRALFESRGVIPMFSTSDNVPSIDSQLKELAP